MESEVIDPAGDDEVERLGFVPSVMDAWFRPKRFFKRLGKRRVRFPVLLVVGSFMSSAVGTGLLLGFEEQGTKGVLGWITVWVGWAAVMALPVFFALAGPTHGVVKLFGGKGGFWTTANALAYASAPNLIGFVPFVGLLAGFWSFVLGIIGLARAQKLEGWRGVVAGLTPTISGVILALLVRSFVIEAFKSPSTSMFPTLGLRDHFFVQKLTYGAGATPARGELIVFENPYGPAEAEPQKYVKRVVAVGGDLVVVNAGHLIVNGWRAPTCRVGSVTVVGETEGNQVEMFVEWLDGRAYLIAVNEQRLDETQGPFAVKPGELFVLGDNRSNSADSRSWGSAEGGGVPLGNLVGSVWAFWYPPSRVGDPLNEPVLPEGAAGLGAALAACLRQAPKPEQTKPPAPRAN